MPTQPWALKCCHKKGLSACRTEALIKSGKVADVSITAAQKNYKKALEKGLLKILSKACDSSLASGSWLLLHCIQHGHAAPVRSSCVQCGQSWRYLSTSSRPEPGSPVRNVTLPQRSGNVLS